MKNFWVKKALFIPIIVAAIVFVLGSVVMLLWNAIIPPLFNIGQISFWQAVGILLLSKILFGGFHHGHGHNFGRWGHMHRRWNHMSDEERSRFREEWKKRCPSDFWRHIKNEENSKSTEDSK
jgi:hypothetical protein